LLSLVCFYASILKNIHELQIGGASEVSLFVHSSR
jgi:hypothetical protein